MITRWWRTGVVWERRARYKGLRALTIKCYAALMKASEILHTVEKGQSHSSAVFFSMFFGGVLLLVFFVTDAPTSNADFIVGLLLAGVCAFFGFRALSRIQSSLELLKHEFEYGHHSYLLKREEREARTEDGG